MGKKYWQDDPDDHHGKPPWMWHQPPWQHHHPFPKHWERRRGLFFRFARTFGCMTILVLGAMATLGTMLVRRFAVPAPGHFFVWLIGVTLVVILPLLAGLMARRAFHSIATPLADVMAAADTVARGDLSVRVTEGGHSEFGQLARSFNRMAEELERADRRRRNLTADVAHELRTPLHIIQGNLEGILDDVYEATPEHIEATLEETRQLARLVEDLRTLSLAEAGQLPLSWEEVDVAELLTDARTSFSGQAEAAGIDLCLDLPADTAPLVITADMGRLDQVLSNLLANAIRHTPAGGAITLQAGPTQEGVCIQVQDTGEGIPAEDLPYIFDRFWKGDRARSHASGSGSGLGLAIARQLVHVHGGRIHVESEPGQGTTFTIHLPKTGSSKRSDPARP